MPDLSWKILRFHVIKCGRKRMRNQKSEWGVIPVFRSCPAHAIFTDRTITGSVRFGPISLRKMGEAGRIGTGQKSRSGSGKQSRISILKNRGVALKQVRPPHFWPCNHAVFQGGVRCSSAPFAAACSALVRLEPVPVPRRGPSGSLRAAPSHSSIKKYQAGGVGAPLLRSTPTRPFSALR